MTVLNFIFLTIQIIILSYLILTSKDFYAFRRDYFKQKELKEIKDRDIENGGTNKESENLSDVASKY